MGKLTRRVLGIAPREVSFARRRFRCDSAAVRQRLEGAAASFVAGYHLALEGDDPELLATRIRAGVAPEATGFAFEGAGMALSLLDILTPWRRDRLARLLAGPGAAHVYIIHVGAGWALARLPVPVERLLARLDPVMGWLALDGYGFHQGFFHWPEAVTRQRVPRKLRGYARRVFDQGLGRSLWFVEGAGPQRIAAAIGAFPPDRQGDLWAGTGLASAYAGGADRAGLAALATAADRHLPALAQGVTFAAKSRQRAGNPTAGTALACEVICGLTIEEAAAVTDRAQLEALAVAAAALKAGPEPAARLHVPLFELWRQSIQQNFLRAGEGAAR
jgi:hypothetical protein